MRCQPVLFSAAKLGSSMKKLILLIASVFWCVSAGAQLVADNDDVLRDLFENQLGLAVSEINPAAMPGLREVITSQGVFYATPDGQYLLRGLMYNLTEGLVNETEKTMTRVRLAGVASFADSKLIFPAKDEKYKITVFTDTTCTYCRRMHSQIDEYNDLGITVEYMAFPRYGTEHPSFNELESIWCADKPQEAMTKGMAGQKVKPKQCDNRLAEQYAFAQSVGVNSTPAIIAKDGSLMPGYLPPKQLLQTLQKIK